MRNIYFNVEVCIKTSPFKFNLAEFITIYKLCIIVHTYAPFFFFFFRNTHFNSKNFKSTQNN